MIVKARGRRHSGLLATIGTALLLLGCGQSGAGETKVTASPPVEEGAEEIPVRSDPATYYLIRMAEMPNGNYEVVTRRDGRSGTSYSRREVDCNGETWTFRYLGEGDTQVEAEEDVANPGRMAELVPGSISSEVTNYVCLSIRE